MEENNDHESILQKIVSNQELEDPVENRLILNAESEKRDQFYLRVTLSLNPAEGDIYERMRIHSMATAAAIQDIQSVSSMSTQSFLRHWRQVREIEKEEALKWYADTEYSTYID